MLCDIGIDLGTENARIAELKKGTSVEVSARLAFREGKDIPICCGDVAGRIQGRTCEGVNVCAPLKDGVLAGNFYADRYLRWAFRQCMDIMRGKRFGTMITCAPFSRAVQQDALLTASSDAGAWETCLVRSDMACALGAGLELNAPEAKMVVDIGAGKVTATVFTMGRVASFGFIPYGMDRLDDKIRRLVRAEKGFRIGMKSARQIKHAFSTALPDAAPKDLTMHMTGISMSERLPGEFDLEIAPVLSICEETVREIVQLCITVLAEVPDGAAADLYDTGVILTGGGTEMEGIDKRIGSALGIPCKIAEAPTQCAVNGLLKIMREPENYQTAIMESSSGRSNR